MAEFKLSFTASEIDEKLKKVDSITSGISSWNELTDKPFYEEQNREEILAETTLEFESEPYIEISPSPFILVEGEKYLVVWNGVEHECVCGYNADAGGAFFLTNFQETAEGETGNFIIIYASPELTGADDGAALFQTITGLGTYTVAIYHDTSVIKHIDPKYLPEALQIGEEQVREDVLVETALTLFYISDYGAYGYGFNFSDDAPLFPLSLGDECTVIWDGDVYEVTVGDSSTILPNTLYIGNGSALGLPGNGEPFAIAWDSTGETGVSILSTVDMAETAHTVSIYHDTTVIKPLDPKYLPDTASGGSAEIPVFDLAAMGMEVMDINSNSSAMIETDTTEIYAALDKGAVTFSLLVTMNGETVTAICTAHSLKSIEYEQHQCVASLWLGNDLSYVAINVTKSGYIQVAALPMAQMVKDFVDAVNKTATTVDLSAYESNGTIVETYSDGSTITYTMNFDDEGNPTKITDSDGNVTNLTW